MQKNNALADQGLGANGEGGASAPLSSPQPLPAGEDAFAYAHPRLRPLLRWIDAIFAILAGLTLASMMVMTLFDVLGRYFISRPLGFAFEMTQIGMAVVVFLALPCVTLRSEHVTAGLFDGIFRGRGKHLRDAVFLAVGSMALAFVGLKLIKLATRFYNYGERTSVLHLPVAYPAWLGVFCLYFSTFLAAVMAILAVKRGLFK